MTESTTYNEEPTSDIIQEACQETIDHDPDNAVTQLRTGEFKPFLLGYLSGKTMVRLSNAGWITKNIDIKNDITKRLIKLLNIKDHGILY